MDAYRPEAYERYLEEMDREPPQAPEEYAWQWRYSGKDSERQQLLELIQDECESEQMELFAPSA